MKILILRNLALTGTAVAILTGSSACSHYFYGANVHQNALLEKKNEVVAMATAGISDETSFNSLNIAYAPTHRLGLYGQYYRASAGTGYNSGGYGAYGDIAVGLFDTIQGHFRYELMLGIGNGRVLNNLGPNMFIENNFNKYFTQLNLGYRSPHFEMCFALRAAMVNQYNIYPTDTANLSKIYITDFTNLSNHPNRMFIEPGIYISGGLRNWKLQLGLGGSTMLAAKPETYYAYQKTFISLGLKVNFTAIK